MCRLESKLLLVASLRRKDSRSEHRSQAGSALDMGWGWVEQGTQRLKSLSPWSSHSRGGDNEKKYMLRRRKAGKGNGEPGRE